MKFLLGFILILFMSNGLTAQVVSSNGKTYDVNQSDESSIQFLMIHIAKENGIDKIEIVKSMVQPGRLKKDIDISIQHVSADRSFTCSILNVNGEILLEQAMPYPLIENVEYVDEETDEFKRQEIEFEKKDFLIRIPFNKANAFLKFEKSNTNGEKELISLLSL